MTLAAIRSALETQLATITPPIDTAYENAPYAPVAGTPYQACYVLLAAPLNIEMGPGFTDTGFFQVSLYYPKDKGPAAALARAEMIRTAFPFASSLTSGSTVVNIIATPEVGPARPDEDRFMVPVKIKFQSRTGG